MKLAGKVVLNYFILLILFFLFMVMSQTIPSYKLFDNVKKSMETIQSESISPKIGGIYIYRLDNFTDALMLNIAVSVEDNSPVQSAMLNRCYRLDNLKELDYATEMITNGQKELLIEETYCRYWHGNQVILRPLLLFFDYNMIRTLNYFCFGLLLGILVYLMFKKCNKAVPITFLLSLLLINFPIIPLSIQFSTVFYIVFFSLIVMLCIRNKIMKLDWFICFFFTIGGLTTYLDLMTVPLITLCLPLIIYLVCINKKNRYRNIIIASIFWTFGYGVIWFSKLAIGSLLTDINMIEEGINQVVLRTSNYYLDFDMSISGICLYLWNLLTTKHLIILVSFLLLLIAVTAFLFYYFSYGKKTIKDNLYLLLIASMPFIWCLVVRNHSVIHIWFVWRLFVITIFSLLLFFAFTLNFKDRKSKSITGRNK